MRTDVAVLRSLLAQAPSSRPELATRTGLSKPTTASAVARLLAAGLVAPDGHRRGERGRSPACYRPDPDIGLLAALDLGGSNLRVAVSDAAGEVLLEDRRRTVPRGAEHVALQAADLVDDLLERAGRRVADVLAVGVSTPGVLDRASGLLRLAYNLGQAEDADVVTPLRERFGADLVVENNVNCAVVGERWRGVARDVRDFVFLSVGAGVGMGIVSGGELLRGRHGAAGEVAYLPLTGDPLADVHRRRGALEDAASATGILDAAARHDGWPGGEPETVEELFALAAGGLRVARSVVADEARLLGLAVAAVATVVDPELVVLGGGIGANPLLLPGVRATVEQVLPFAPEVVTTGLGRSAGVIGALALARDRAHEILLERAAGLGQR